MKKNRYISLLIVLLLLGVLPGATRAASKQPDAKNAAGPVNLVWPLPPDKPRVRFLEAFSNNFDIEPLKKRSWVDKMVGNGDPNIPEFFERPSGVATDSKGRIFIASTQKVAVYIIEKEKHQVTKIVGDRGITFRTPLGIVVDKNDNFYVADGVLAMVLKFDPQGHLLSTFGSDAGLKNPTFMGLDEARRRIFVVDSKLHQVFIFNLDTLQLQAKVGKRGDKNGEFNYPIGIGVAPDGSFAVTDTGSCSVQIFSPELKFVRRIGKQGPRPGEFVRPKGVAYDSEGHLWVVDAAFSNFQVFTPDGKLLLFVGTFGEGPGQFNLPIGIYIDHNNRVYVSDSLNARVQIFQFLGGN